jgi:YHS domain-containing protein
MKTLLTFVSVALLAVSAIAQETQQKSTLTDADQLQIAVQKICPVSGGALGSMGDPVKVKVGEQVAFLCCKGCQGKELNAEHWKTIQTNIAAAQGTCPIMGKPVDASMKSTVVNGQQVFVCCPPCIAKIQADADGSLKKVNASYVSFVAKERQAKSDQLHATAQGICPVSGQKLGSMGAPIKVKVGEKEVAFLCCKGCVGKALNAEHWKTIQTNLATAQKTCPVMGKAVDASMKSTVVNGRKIFVCCPPCIKKIDADPAAYVAKLDAQIAASSKQK